MRNPAEKQTETEPEGDDMAGWMHEEILASIDPEDDRALAREAVADAMARGATRAAALQAYGYRDANGQILDE